jgi:multiple sugar transport system substrate-binding protein
MAAGVAVLLLGAVTVFAFRGGSEPTPSRAESAGPPVIDPAWMRDAKDTVTYCTGADTVKSKDGRSQHDTAVEAFNAKFGPRLHAVLHAFADDASQQYAQIRRVLQAHSDACDVIYADVVWTADFAHNHWLYDLTPYLPRSSLGQFVAAMQDAAVYRGKVWAVPKQADAGVLYYNKAHVKHPPKTWEELYRQAAEGRGQRLRYQGLAYEGLTVNFLELAYALGATDIVMPGGKANINQPKALRALQIMVGGINSAVPREIVNQKETASLYSFAHRHGGTDFMRNWATSYAELKGGKYPNIAGEVGVAPLPHWDGNAPVSVLGGHVLVIPAFSRNPGAALKLVDFLASRQVLKQDAVEFSLAPARVDLWDDRDVQQGLPAFAYLKSAIQTARSRPITPNYPAVSAAIYNNVNRALMRHQSPEDALDQADYEMQRALDQIPRTR